MPVENGLAKLIGTLSIQSHIPGGGTAFTLHIGAPHMKPARQMLATHQPAILILGIKDDQRDGVTPELLRKHGKQIAFARSANANEQEHRAQDAIDIGLENITEIERVLFNNRIRELLITVWRGFHDRNKCALTSRRRQWLRLDDDFRRVAHHHLRKALLRQAQCLNPGLDELYSQDANK